jgi:hypothetical protein
MNRALCKSSVGSQPGDSYGIWRSLAGLKHREDALGDGITRIDVFETLDTRLCFVV